MPHVLVRNLDASVIARLEKRAKGNGRSLQGELKAILEQSASVRASDTRRTALAIQARLRRIVHSDSARLVARDRAR